MVHEQMTRFFQGFRRDAHPMAVMVGCVGALSAFYHDSTDISDPYQRMVASIRMIAKCRLLRPWPTSIRSASRSFIPRMISISRRTSCVCALRAVRGVQTQSGARACHGPASSSCTATTSKTRRPSTVRLARSSGANPFACIAAGIACLWGPAHGGANEAALENAVGNRHGRPHSRIHQAPRRTRTIPSV